jgi:enoyl-CoA hydratase/carnithine racemase
MNTLTPQLIDELGRAVRHLMKSGSKVVVITGDERAFCAGADLSLVRAFKTAESFIPWMDSIQTTYTELEAAGVITIAAIDGFCLGGGLEMALRCDFRLATNRAQLGLPEIRHGLLPTGGGLTTLVSIVGLPRTKDLVLSGRMVAADEALQMGLLHDVVDQPVLESAIAWAEQFKGHPRLAIHTAKKALRLSRTGASPGWSETVEGLTASVLIGSTEAKRGIEAFLAKTAIEYE